MLFMISGEKLELSEGKGMLVNNRSEVGVELSRPRCTPMMTDPLHPDTLADREWVISRCTFKGQPSASTNLIISGFSLLAAPL